MKNLLILIPIIALSLAAAHGETPADVVLAQGGNLASENLEQRLAARDAIQAAGARASRPGAEAERSAFAKEAIKFLADSNPQATRVWLVRMLGLFGGEESVPALAKLLAAADPELRDAARRALQAIASPKAGEALRAALTSAQDPIVVRGLLDALAFRRDASDVDLIAKRLHGAEPAVASAAALALGKIGDPKAVAALVAAGDRATAGLRHDIANAILNAEAADAAALMPLVASEDPTLRATALARLAKVSPSSALPKLSEAMRAENPTVVAATLRVAADSRDTMLVKTVIEALPRLRPGLQAIAATVLAESGVKEASGAVAQLLRSPVQATRLDAIAALGKIGGADAVPPLLDRLANAPEDEERAAERAISVISDASVDEHLIKAAKGGSGPSAAAAIRALAARNPNGAAAIIIDLAKSQDTAVQMAALDGLKQAGGSHEFTPILEMVIATQDAGVRSKAISAAGAIASRASDREGVVAALRRIMGTAPPELRAAIVPLLAAAPCPSALQTAVAAFADADGDVRDAAMRALSGWPDFSAADSLLKIARGTPVESKHYVLAMRGIAKLLGLNSAPVGQRIKVAREAIAAAKRPDEKKIIIAALPGLKANEAQSLLKELSSDPAVGAEASAALQKFKK